jgi:hypothetical protein
VAWQGTVYNRSDKSEKPRREPTGNGLQPKIGDSVPASANQDGAVVSAGRLIRRSLVRLDLR